MNYILSVKIGNRFFQTISRFFTYSCHKSKFCPAKIPSLPRGGRGGFICVSVSFIFVSSADEGEGGLLCS